MLFYATKFSGVKLRKGSPPKKIQMKTFFKRGVRVDPEVNILSKFQLPSSYGLGIMMFWRFEGLEKKDYLMNKWISEIMTKVIAEQPPLHSLASLDKPQGSIWIHVFVPWWLQIYWSSSSCFVFLDKPEGSIWIHFFVPRWVHINWSSSSCLASLDKPQGSIWIHVFLPILS